MDHLSPSTINVRMSVILKLVGEARRNRMIGLEEAANLTDIPNVRQKGTRLGNWLTREQAKELLAVPDRSTLKGKRDYVIIALLVGCALRRRELATLLERHSQRLLPRPDSGAFLHPMLMTKLIAMFAPVLFWHLARGAAPLKCPPPTPSAAPRRQRRTALAGRSYLGL
jgi:hypothetical protein